MQIPSVIIRNFAPGDLGNIKEFLARSGRTDPGERHKISPLVKMELSRPGYMPEKDLFLAEMNREMIGFCDIDAELKIKRAVLSGFIASDSRRKGVGKEMMTAVLRRAQEIQIKVVHVPVPERRPEAGAFLGKQGFFQVRSFFEMELTLSDIAEKNTSASYHGLASFRAGEEAQLAELQNRVFFGTWGFCPNSEEDIQYYLRLTGSRTGDVLILREDSAIAGYVWPHLVAEKTSVNIGKRGRIHMWGVVPEHREKGRGRELLLAGLNRLEDMGADIVELSVDSGNVSALSLYCSLGFRIQAKTIWFEKTIAGK